MNADAFKIYISGIDEERFGIRIARAIGVTLDTLASVMAFCAENQVVLLIARCLASEHRTAQAMEQEGFLLMDTLIYYVRKIGNIAFPLLPSDLLIRQSKPGEEHEIGHVAVESFRGYLGHYHADERLDREKCDETYKSWAMLSCTSRNVADEVLVAEKNGRIVGFATLRLRSKEQAEGVLFGVAPKSQGEGIYQSLMMHGLKWSEIQGAKEMVVSTQLTNISVQKVWVRLGFEPSHAYYTFHKWFDDL